MPEATSVVKVGTLKLNDRGLTRLQALVVLHVVTIIWGTQHAVIKLAVEVTMEALAQHWHCALQALRCLAPHSQATGDPATITLVRFSIATLAFAPFVSEWNVLVPL